MRILAVDTALGACSAAIIDGDDVLAHRFLVMERGHAEALAPMVQECMDQAGCNFSEIDRLAVTTGPGTFTGQRVGIAFMRALRIALAKDLVGLTTLSVMAYQAMAETGCPTGVSLHDARRGEVYAEAVGTSLFQALLLPFDEAVMRVSCVGERAVLAGSAAARAHERLPRTVLSAICQPDALWVAKLARTLPAPDAPPRPLYLRAPDAKIPVRS